MKWYLCFLFLCVGLVVADEELPLAEICDPENCLLPDCRCSSTSIPGNLQPKDTPQFVLLTFDDAVSITNIPTYRRILDGRTNFNNCPAGATFFISHEYTNYQLVNELYNKGHEIALHSITHRTPQTFWQEATTEDMRREIGDQKQQMSHFANIPMDAIRGVRMPFLQMTGNATFEVMAEFGIEYDLTWPTITHYNPGIWPYTLDFASTQDCVTPPCPTASIPGVWVLPMITWRDLNGNACAMVDSCFATFTPPRDDEEGWFQFIVQNFERHYFGNRAPFGFYVHEWFISIHPAIERALVRFMDMVNNLPDAYMVTGQEVIDWVKDPVPVNEYNAKPCKWLQTSPCPATNCGPLPATHNEQNMWIGICSACPRTYPWINNPLGQ